MQFFRRLDYVLTSSEVGRRVEKLASKQPSSSKAANIRIPCNEVSGFIRTFILQPINALDQDSAVVRVEISPAIRFLKVVSGMAILLRTGVQRCGAKNRMTFLFISMNALIYGQCNRSVRQPDTKPVGSQASPIPNDLQ